MLQPGLKQHAATPNRPRRSFGDARGEHGTGLGSVTVDAPLWTNAVACGAVLGPGPRHPVLRGLGKGHVSPPSPPTLGKQQAPSLCPPPAAPVGSEGKA